MVKTKLLQGDCSEKLIEVQDNSINAIITDPPFNLVGKMGGSIHLFRQSKKDGNNNYNKKTMDYDTGFDQITWIKTALKKLKKGGHLIIFNDWENMGDISKELKANNVKVKSLNHWQKTNPQPAEWKRRFVPGREYFLHAITPGKYTFNLDKIHHGDFIMGLTPGKEKKFGKHPNQKPIQLMEELIKILTNKGDTILDCFMGSGTTGVACKNLERDFVGIELDKEYFEIAKERINKLNSEEQVKTCVTKHVIHPKHKCSGILPNLT